MKALADASGSLGNLTSLLLGGNQIGDPGMSSQIVNGSLGNLEKLWLSNNAYWRPTA